MQNIADKYGVSRQRVQQVLSQNGVKARRHSKTYENIPYKGLYEYVAKNRGVSITSLASLMFGRADKAKDAKITRMLQGADTQLTIGQIKRLEEASGMPFSYLFETREKEAVGRWGDTSV